MEEIWKTYKITHPESSLKRVYEVSNYGRVKINGVLVDLDKDYKHKWYYRFGSGYPVHKAVAELFIPNPDNKPCVDHIDTNTFNNRVDNLRWVTYKENQNNKLTKQHISESLKGRVFTEEWKKNISTGTKIAMSNLSDESKNRMRHYGNKYGKGERSIEQKRNIAIATRKAMTNPDVRIKMSNNKRAQHYRWMNNGIDSKPIPLVDQQYYLDLGWKYGRIL